jgi:hypothetical protein
MWSETGRYESLLREQMERCCFYAFAGRLRERVQVRHRGKDGKTRGVWWVVVRALGNPGERKSDELGRDVDGLVMIRGIKIRL